MTPKILYPIVAISILIAAFFAFNSYIYNTKQQSENNNIQSYLATLSGEFVCLPHADQSGPQTLECAYGLKTPVGEYYALDLNSLPQDTQSQVIVGDHITASGTIVPLEMISSNHWAQYPIEGIFSVTHFLEKN